MYAYEASREHFVSLYKLRLRTDNFRPTLMGNPHLDSSVQWLCFIQRTQSQRGVIRHSGKSGEKWLFLTQPDGKVNKLRVDGYSESGGQRFVYEYDTCATNSLVTLFGYSNMKH